LTVPGSEHLGRSGGGCQPGAYMHGHADELVVQDLPRARVNADAYLDSQRLSGVNDRLGDAQRPRWAVEGGQEAVAGAVDLAAAEPGQFVADQPVVLGHQVPPSAVTEAGGVLGRGDDVGEQHRGKDPVRRDRFPDAGEELADLGHDVVAIGPWGMIGAGQFNVFAVANMAGQEAGVFSVAHDSATDTTD
jgi:hypothetical protein